MLEETSVQLPILVVETQFNRRNIDEMRWIAYYQVPLLGCWNIVEIVGVIDRNPLCQSVLRHCPPARFDGFRIDVGETQCVAKSVAKQSEAYEPRAGAPLEDAPLTRHAEIVKQRQVFHARKVRPPPSRCSRQLT